VEPTIATTTARAATGIAARDLDRRGSRATGYRAAVGVNCSGMPIEDQPEALGLPGSGPAPELLVAHPRCLAHTA
jgi:hypothetical protein